jgi:hypothetical protein
VVIWKAALPSAVSRSASSRASSADLPPSSRKTFLMLPAPARITVRPVAVEPVKVIMSTRGSSASCWPTSCREETTTLNTPAGMSVSSATMRPSTVADHGVSGAGLSTTVLPAARAGTAFARLICIGKFHGVIAPTTPAGSRRRKRCVVMPEGEARPRSVSHS